jgi:outer membrane lipoprotein SlyB
MNNYRRVLSGCLAAIVLAGPAVYAQRAGDSISVRTGTVTGMRSVDLNDGNALGGAVVGGAMGAALTRSKRSSSTRNRNAAIGAVLGTAAAASQSRPGRIYSVTVADGSVIQIATEQTEIREGDCVYVEQSGSSANIRRAPTVACQPASQDLLQEPAMVEEMREEAQECITAKNELINANDDAAMDRAVRKIQLLCYD